MLIVDSAKKGIPLHLVKVTINGHDDKLRPDKIYIQPVWYSGMGAAYYPEHYLI